MKRLILIILSIILFSCIDSSLDTRSIDNTGRVSQAISGGGIYDVTSYGADPVDNPAQDDGPGIQSAINSAISVGGGNVVFPFGVYNIVSPIQIHYTSYLSPVIDVDGSGSTIRVECPSGKDQNGTCLIPIENALSLRIHSRLSIHNLTIKTNKTAQNGIKGYKLIHYQTELARIQVSDAISHGVLIEDSTGMAIRDSSSMTNGGSGWYLNGCNACSMIGIYSYQNNGSGIIITNHSSWSGAMFLSDFISEQNQGHGVQLLISNGSTASLGGTTIRNGWIEGNLGDGILVGSRSARIEDNRIIAGGIETTTRAIRITADKGASIRSNSVTGTTNSATYAMVMTEGGASNHVLSGNTSVYVGSNIMVCTPSDVQTCNAALIDKCGGYPPNYLLCNQAYTTCSCVTSP